MTVNSSPTFSPASPARAPRFGGALWSLVRRTNRLMLPLAGKRWNPAFAVLEHRGRRTGRPFATPLAARRVTNGFVISLAFGAQVDWYLNLSAAGGGTIRWRGQAYRITDPERIDATTGIAAFHPIQRMLLRSTGVEGFVRVHDAPGEVR